jgi:hypothetical protein
MEPSLAIQPNGRIFFVDFVVMLCNVFFVCLESRNRFLIEKRVQATMVSNRFSIYQLPNLRNVLLYQYMFTISRGGSRVSEAEDGALSNGRVNGA